MSSGINKDTQELYKQGEVLLEKLRIVTFLTTDKLVSKQHEKLTKILMSSPESLENASYYSKIQGFETFFDKSKHIMEYLDTVPQVFLELSEYSETFVKLLQRYVNSQFSPQHLLLLPKLSLMLLKCLTNLFRFQHIILNISNINELINGFLFAHSIYNDSEYVYKTKIFQKLKEINKSPLSLVMGLENYAPLFTPILLKAAEKLDSYKNFTQLKFLASFSFYDNSRVTLKTDLNDTPANLLKYREFFELSSLKLSIYLSILIFPSLLEENVIYGHVHGLLSGSLFLYVDSMFTLNISELLEKAYKENKKRFSPKIKKLLKCRNSVTVSEYYEDLSGLLKYCDFQLNFITNLTEADPMILTKLSLKILSFIKVVREIVVEASVNLVFYSEILSKTKIVETLTIRLFKLISNVLYLEKLYIRNYGKIAKSYRPILEKLKNIHEFTSIENIPGLLNTFTCDFNSDQESIIKLENFYTEYMLENPADMSAMKEEVLNQILTLIKQMRLILDPKRTLLEVFDYTYIIVNTDLDFIFWSHCRILNQIKYLGCFIGLYDRVCNYQFTYLVKGKEILEEIQKPKIVKMKEFFKDFISESLKHFLNNRYSLFYTSLSPYFYISAMDARLPNAKGVANSLPAGTESSFLTPGLVKDMRSIKKVLEDISSIFQRYPGKTIDDISIVIPDIIRSVLIQFAAAISIKKGSNTPQTIFETCQFLFYSLFSAPKGIFAANNVKTLSSTFYEIVGFKPMSKEVEETMKSVSSGAINFKNVILEGYFSLIDKDFTNCDVLYIEELKCFFTQIKKNNKKTVEVEKQLISITNPAALQTLFNLLGPKSCELIEDTILEIIHKSAQKMRQNMMSEKETIMAFKGANFGDLTYLKTKISSMNYKIVIDSLIQIGTLLKLKNTISAASVEVIKMRHPFHKQTVEAFHKMAYYENSDNLKYTLEFADSIGLQYPLMDYRVFKKLEESFVRSKEIMELFEETTILSILSLRWSEIAYHHGAQTFSNNISCITSAIIAIVAIKTKLRNPELKTPAQLNEKIKDQLVKMVELAGNAFWNYGKDLEFGQINRKKLGLLLARMIKDFGIIPEVRNERFNATNLLLGVVDLDSL
eukprot:GAHX01000643.1.p1 GENE.GAHX01000643.1~~GAHX01000643.1.p1  ORF type:complete len:1106 (-),score=221.08 GAHX01000643.1:30-3347(-)